MSGQPFVDLDKQLNNQQDLRVAGGYAGPWFDRRRRASVVHSPGGGALLSEIVQFGVWLAQCATTFGLAEGTHPFLVCFVP